ncbi:MAG: tRNA-uridine aminocarboxypropyltransferase [Cellvibrionaceae bacterium]
MPRQLCPQCQLPAARCFCDYVVDSQSSTKLVVWQHPSEVDHPKNTLPLLKACLPQLTIIRGERILKTDFLKTTATDSEGLHLLFPSTAPSLEPTERSSHRGSNMCILALDGTWRKARKIVHLNPWLHTLPTISLIDPPSSHYRIRKAEKQGQLSTLEAVCAAIHQLDGNSHTSGPILSAFEQYMHKLDVFRP